MSDDGWFAKFIAWLHDWPKSVQPDDVVAYRSASDGHTWYVTGRGAKMQGEALFERGDHEAAAEMLLASVGLGREVEP